MSASPAPSSARVHDSALAPETDAPPRHWRAATVCRVSLCFVLGFCTGNRHTRTTFAIADEPDVFSRAPIGCRWTRHGRPNRPGPPGPSVHADIDSIVNSHTRNESRSETKPPSIKKTTVCAPQNWQKKTFHSLHQVFLEGSLRTGSLLAVPVPQNNVRGRRDMGCRAPNKINIRPREPRLLKSVEKGEEETPALEVSCCSTLIRLSSNR